MPTRRQSSVRRSMRNRGVSHNLLSLTDSPIKSQRPRGGPKQKVSNVKQNETIGQVGKQCAPSPVVDSEKSTSTYVASDSEEETEPIKRSQTKKLEEGSSPL